MLETLKLWRNTGDNTINKQVYIWSRLRWVWTMWMLFHSLEVRLGSWSCRKNQCDPSVSWILKRKKSTVSPAKHHHTTSSTLQGETTQVESMHSPFPQPWVEPEVFGPTRPNQSRAFHWSNALSLCLLAQTFLFSCWSFSVEVSLQLFHHKGLFQVVSEQLMLRWFCCLSSIKHLCCSYLNCWSLVLSEAGSFDEHTFCSSRTSLPFHNSHFYYCKTWMRWRILNFLFAASSKDPSQPAATFGGHTGLLLHL